MNIRSLYPETLAKLLPNVFSRNGEESSKKVLDPHPEVDEFQIIN